jgi:hypothetical protein
MKSGASGFATRVARVRRSAYFTTWSLTGTRRTISCSRWMSSPVRTGDEDVEHEAVELGLGQRVGALLLDRVLGGEDEERLRQRVGGPAGGDLVLLHRLEQRRLRLRRGPVDLVGQDDRWRRSAP